jgi:hypothetical protein
MTADELLSMYMKDLENHVLTCLCDTEHVQCYRMGKPGTGTMSTYVTFTPAGICLQGDFTPKQNGSVSSRGYGVDWFSGELGGSYICEKFLQRKWVAELAADELRSSKCWARDGASDHVRIELDGLVRQLDGGEMDGRQLHDAMEDLGLEVSDGMPGWGYDPREEAALRAIQQTFARLYRASKTA